MSSFARNVCITIVGVIASCLLHGRLTAQSTVPDKPDSDAGAIAASAEDAARRLQIMTGPTWKQVQAEYQKWIMVQVVYSPEQVKQLNDKIAYAVRTLPADELQEFIDDWNAKLKLVTGQNAGEAREWLGVYMTNMADGYRKQYLKRMGLTDIASLSAAQLETKIAQVRGQRMKIQQGQAAFDQSRQQTLQATQQQVATTQSARNAAAASMSSNNNFQSPYSPADKATWTPPNVAGILAAYNWGW